MRRAEGQNWKTFNFPKVGIFRILIADPPGVDRARDNKLIYT